VRDYFKRRRLERGLTVPQLARMIGYQNVSRGIRRIMAFEETGHAHPKLLMKLTNALDIDQATVARLAYADWCERFKAMNQPIEPYLVRRLLYGGGTRLVPRHLHSTEAIERYAAHFAKRCGTEVCLILSQRVRMWFNPDGTLKEVIEQVPGGE